ncbi:MAG: methyltransferase domain-containing protein [Chloroflexi bacterium]|nr:methyltransferase domain-containing protein [Chloroflexota bacterium]
MLRKLLGMGVPTLRKYISRQPWLHEQFAEIVNSWLKPSHIVLNAGCGIRPRIPERGSCAWVIGADLEQEGVTNPGVDAFVRADLGSLPFRDAIFDLITCYETAEHLLDPQSCFDEFYRVCKDGAIVIIVTPNVLHYHNFLVKVTPYAFHEWFTKCVLRVKDDSFPTFFRVNTPRTMKRMMEMHRERENGFKTVEIRCIDNEPLHLDWLTPFYVVGLVYHRLVNRFKILSSLRSDIIGVFRR